MIKSRRSLAKSANSPILATLSTSLSQYLADPNIQLSRYFEYVIESLEDATSRDTDYECLRAILRDFVLTCLSLRLLRAKRWALYGCCPSVVSMPNLMHHEAAQGAILGCWRLLRPETKWLGDPDPVISCAEYGI